MSFQITTVRLDEIEVDEKPESLLLSLMNMYGTKSSNYLINDVESIPYYLIIENELFNIWEPNIERKDLERLNSKLSEVKNYCEENDLESLPFYCTTKQGHELLTDYLQEESIKCLRPVKDLIVSVN